MGYKIRNACEADALLLRQLAQSCKPLDVHTPYTYWVITKFFSESSFVLECDGRAIGFITALHNHDSFFVWQIGILQEYHKQKLSYLLIDRVVSTAKEKGFSSFMLSIDASNEKSNRAFTRYSANNGYTITEKGVVNLKDEFDLSINEKETIFEISF